MKRETITLMLNGLADNYISEATIFCPNAIQESPERIVHMKKKRIVTLVLAAALILALSVAAYAVWSIHTERQQELKADLKIEENNVSSYMEYTAPDEQASGLVLLSSVNDGDVQRVFLCRRVMPGDFRRKQVFPGVLTAQRSAVLQDPSCLPILP